jgi:catechol 2,3-dioxygenase-like lactoylglutathione lyase family enzyme
MAKLDAIHHVAVSVKDIPRAVAWYTGHFNCRVTYQDDTWAMLDFKNIQLALVIPSQHPAHIAVPRGDAEKFGALVTHRDGIRSVYIKDPEGNSIEILDPDSLLG